MHYRQHIQQVPYQSPSTNKSTTVVLQPAQLSFAEQSVLSRGLSFVPSKIYPLQKTFAGACNPKESSSVSSIVLDGAVDHSIDLTDCLGESSDKTADDKNSTSSDAETCKNKQQVF